MFLLFQKRNEFRSSVRGMKICSKFTGEHPCQSAISTKLQGNLIEITLRHACSPVNSLYNFRTPFYKNTSGGLLLNLIHYPFLPTSCSKEKTMRPPYLTSGTDRFNPGILSLPRTLLLPFHVIQVSVIVIQF